MVIRVANIVDETGEYISFVDEEGAPYVHPLVDTFGSLPDNEVQDWYEALSDEQRTELDMYMDALIAFIETNNVQAE